MMDNSVCSLASYKNMTSKQDAKARDRAVRDFCLECMGENSFEVANCKSFYCPLHPYRQTQTDKATLFDYNISDDVILDEGYDRIISFETHQGVIPAPKNADLILGQG